jgi:hypothetical protein
MNKYNILLGYLSIVLLAVSCASSGSTQSYSEQTEVTEKRNISRVSFIKQSPSGNSIEFKFRGGRSQIGASSSGPKSITLQGSSGSQETTRFRGFNNVEFPFEGQIRFVYTKQKNDSRGSQGSMTSAATDVSATLGVKIEEPGKWVITINY